MDSMESLDSDMQMGKVLTDRAQEYLLTACKWSKFLAIVGFVIMGLVILVMVIALVFAGGAGGDLSTALSSEFGVGGIFILLVYIGIFALYFFPLKYLYSFATKTRQGIETSSTVVLTEGLQNLKSFFKFFGIFTAIGIGLYLVAIIIGIFVGALA